MSKKSTHEVVLTIPRGTHDLIIEVGENTPGIGFVPKRRVKEYMPFEKHQLIYGIVKMFQSESLFFGDGNNESPVEVTLIDGWTGISRTFCGGQRAVKGKTYSKLLSPKYADKKLRVAEERKAIWQRGIFRLLLGSFRANKMSKEKFIAEADFLLHC